MMFSSTDPTSSQSITGHKKDVALLGLGHAKSLEKNSSYLPSLSSKGITGKQRKSSTDSTGFNVSLKKGRAVFFGCQLS